jgi:cytochrome P450
MPQTLLDVAREYGGVSRLRLGPASMYLVADGRLIVETLARRPSEFRKSNRTRSSLGGHLGDGLITLEGAEHRRHRRLMQPAMHGRHIAASASIMVDQARRRVESWPDGSEPEMLSEMADLTLRIVSAALFGLTPVDDRDPETTSETYAEEVVAAVHAFARSLNVVLRRAFPLPEWLPTKGNRLRRETVRRVDDLAYRLIRRRRKEYQREYQGEHRGSDLVSMLLAAGEGGEGKRLSDVEVRDELMTLFFAGHETSAVALTWALLLLDQNPSVAGELSDELDAVLAGREPEMADLPRLPLLGRVVKETLRLYPPAWVFDRSPRHDLDLGGYRLPKGANVLLSPWVVHRDPAVWDAPTEFRPNRFLGDPPAREAYLPFGDGPRQCIGSRFAETEIALVLATMLPRVRLSRVGVHPIRPEGDATLRPKGGLRMRVTRR